MIVAPGRWSWPSCTATMRPRLKPCSPPGRPQPRYRSSMSRGSSSGTLSSAVRTIVAVRSSGRTSTREPLKARPMGERAVGNDHGFGHGGSSWSLGYRRVRRTSGQPRTLCCEDGCVARHIYLCPLRWADMDSLGHVNNVTYVDYLQESRVRHAPRARARDRRPAARRGDRRGPPRGRVRLPLLFRPEPVRIESWVTRIRAASFTMAYEILDEQPNGVRRSTRGLARC